MLNDASAELASRYFCFCDVVIDYISQKLCLYFEQYCILSLLAGIPYTKICFWAFSVPPHPTKTVQHCFAGEEPDVYFQVLKLKKLNPQMTQYVTLTFMRYSHEYFASLVLCFGVDIFIICP